MNGNFENYFTEFVRTSPGALAGAGGARREVACLGVIKTRSAGWRWRHALGPARHCRTAPHPDAASACREQDALPPRPHPRRRVAPRRSPGRIPARAPAAPGANRVLSPVYPPFRRASRLAPLERCDALRCHRPAGAGQFGVNCRGQSCPEGGHFLQMRSPSFEASSIGIGSKKMGANIQNFFKELTYPVLDVRIKERSAP